MKKILQMAGMIIGLMLLPGCHEKQWWEDCYKSEEEARIDQLECDISNLEEQLKEKHLVDD